MNDNHGTSDHAATVTPHHDTGPLAGAPASMTLTMASDVTGYSTEFFARLVRRGALPAYRIRGGRRLMIRRDDLEALFERVEVTP